MEEAVKSFHFSNVRKDAFTLELDIVHSTLFVLGGINVVNAKEWHA